MELFLSPARLEIRGSDVPESNMSYMSLTLLTLEAVCQTVIICLLGFWAACHGYLNRDAQKIISNLNIMVFTPCLIFSKMASHLSVSALADIAIIPILFVISTGVSLFCGRWLSRKLHFDRAESNFVTAMAVFGNSNSLPVSLTLALAYTLPQLKWPDLPGDTADNVASRGLLYLLIFQQLGQIVRWSWGYNTLLAKPASVEEGRRAGDGSINDDTDGDNCGNFSSSDDGPRPQVRLAARLGQALATWYRTVRHFMNPPLWSMLIAIVVASIPALKAEIYENDGFLANTFGKAINSVGQVAIPLILVVLGANLAPIDDVNIPPASPNYGKIIAASLLSRMVLPAVVVLPIIALSVKFLNISIMDDPVFLVSSFILTVSPPAIQLSQICQINEVFEKEMAGVLFWGYAVLTLPSTLIIVVTALRVLDWSGVSRS